MLVVVMGATSAVTMSLMGAFSGLAVAPLSEGFVRVSDDEFDRISRYARLDEVRNILKTEYYKNIDDDELVLGAVKGMLAAPDDPYTFYYTPEDTMEMAERSKGVYEGVGLLLGASKDGYLMVLRIFPDTPAIESDLKLGDRIVKINGKEVSAKTGKQMDDAIAIIKDSTDSKVKLTVLRGDDTKDISLEKTSVNIPRTSHKMLDDKIGYIAIYEFMGNDATGFERDLKDLQALGMKALIIDIRSNPGGLLHDVVAIADTLLPKGIIVYTEDRYSRRENHYSDEKSLGIPLCVLVNGMSASASEILAGAVQDYNVGVVVGTKTFGKGIVQTVIPFRSDGASMQLTTASYFTPKGRSIHGIGIEPDINVEIDEDTDLTDLELHPEKDPQLQKAISILKQKLKSQ